MLEAARKRLAGLRSITPPPDFGPNLKVDDYEQQINALSDELDDYNEKNSALDAQANKLKEMEDELGETSKRLLAATGAQFGTNSSQYEQAGGTRDDERKPPSKKGPSKG